MPALASSCRKRYIRVGPFSPSPPAPHSRGDANLALELHWLEAVDDLGDGRHLEILEERERSEEVLVRVEHQLHPDRVRQISEDGRLSVDGFTRGRGATRTRIHQNATVLPSGFCGLIWSYDRSGKEPPVAGHCCTMERRKQAVQYNTIYTVGSVVCTDRASTVSACLPEDAGVPVDVVEVLPHSQLQGLGQLPYPHVLPHFFHLGVLRGSLTQRDKTAQDVADCIISF